MRALLIAYEFPPILAAQSLRWFYLANGLAELGVELHVICPSMPAAKPFPVSLRNGVHVHRVWPGPFIGLSQKLALRTNGGATGAVASEVGGGQNWLLRGYQIMRGFLNAVLYPDVRSEWYPFACRAAGKLLKGGGFDVVISSHEPAVDLFVGLWIKKRFGLPWVVDLADPLLAPYSPVWRRWLDRRVEAGVLQKADAVWVTTPSLVELLLVRHADLQGEKFQVVPQGYPEEDKAGYPRESKATGDMKLLYTGTFYQRFRNPTSLAAAIRVISERGMRINLTIVGDNKVFEPLFAGLPNVDFVGKLDHFACLKMQKEADVLLNLGNAQDYQVPGKIYEYLGANRPVMHIRMSKIDQGADLIEETCSGIVVENTIDEIVTGLTRLHSAWVNGELKTLAPQRISIIRVHTWSSRAASCLATLSKFSVSKHDESMNR